MQKIFIEDKYFFIFYEILGNFPKNECIWHFKLKGAYGCEKDNYHCHSNTLQKTLN